MNIDNQLLLGIVFITAGVAMGLLAYAAFLNRQQSSDDEEKTEEGTPEVSAETEAEGLEDAVPEAAAASVPEPEPGQPPESEPTVKAPEPIATPEPIAGNEAETIATSSDSQAAQATAAETVLASPTPTAAPSERPTVMVDRDPNRDRLMVKVDDKTYHSMEALRDSDDWDRVTDLFSDLLAWMIKAEGSRQSEGDDSEEAPQQPVSMIQEINSILGKQLAETDSGPQAVRLMEGAGGSIRVYIGVESFSIDDVPDAEVKALIRQAVAEWEARQ